MNIPKRLKELMQANKISAPKLAAAANVPLASIKSILYHRSHNPRIKTLLALSNALKCDIYYLLSDDPIIIPENDEQENILFLQTIDMVQEIANNNNINLDDKREFKRCCVERIFAYSHGANKQTVDDIFAEWVFFNEWKSMYGDSM